MTVSDWVLDDIPPDISPGRHPDWPDITPVGVDVRLPSDWLCTLLVVPHPSSGGAVGC